MTERELVEQAAATLRCAECGRPWLDPRERWYGELTVGDEANEDELEAVVFCPTCAQREFGGDS